MPPSSTVNRTTQPAIRSDHTRTSPGNPTPHTGTPHGGGPQSLTPTARPGLGIPGQRSAERGTPNPASPEPSPASRQEGSVEEDWGSPKFVQDKVTGLGCRTSTVSNHLREVTKAKENPHSEDHVVKLISDLSGQLKQDVKKELAEFRHEMLAGVNKAVQEAVQEAVNGGINDAVKDAIKMNLTETLGPMSVTTTQSSGTVDVVRKDVEVLKNVVGLVEPVSSGLVGDLRVIMGRARQLFGRTFHEGGAQLVRSAPGTISPATILGPTIDAGITRSGIVPDVPATPTAPDTPSSERPLSLAEAQMLHFLETLHGLIRLYNTVTVKERM